MTRVAVVVGARSALGRATVDGLVARGFRVYATQTAPSEAEEDESVRRVRLDVTSRESCEALRDQLERDEERVDVLIDVAGESAAGPLLQADETEYSRLLDVNAVGAFRLLKAFAPLLGRGERPRVIFVASLNCVLALPGFALYSSSKFALVALARAADYELSPEGVRVVALAPGAFASGRADPVRGTGHLPLRERSRVARLLLPIPDADAVARRILALVDDPRPPALAFAGRDARLVARVQPLIPARLWDSLVKRLLGVR